MCWNISIYSNSQFHGKSLFSVSICNLFSLIFFSATARSFILYSDRPVVTSKSSSTFATNDSENKVINDDEECDATKKSAADGDLRGNCQPDEIVKSTFTSDETTTTTTTKSAYHSFYVYPRPQGSVQHSPNLLWHEVNFQNRGRSLSPSVNKIRTEFGTRECQR